MKRYCFTLIAAAATLIVAPNLTAQQLNRLSVIARPETTTVALPENLVIALPDSATVDTAKKIAKGQSKFLTTAPGIEMQNYRPEDKRGINVFEAPKDESVAYTGFKLQWGAAFTQQFQGLDHSNTAAPRLVTAGTPPVTTDANKLVQIGHGPNNATANLYLNGQLARTAQQPDEVRDDQSRPF